MADNRGFRSRHPGRCSACRAPYPIGERVTATTAAHETPPEFAHYPACPPRPGAPLDPEAHYPARIGTRHEDGSRTHAPPGEVCAGCSDRDTGRWVPVSDCSIAWAKFEQQDHRAAPWLT